jgi:selenocysteine lyase/cysteine desulfurase
VELAADRGLTVQVVGARDDLTIDMDDLESKLGERTRVVAFAWASNATGSLADAERICRLARSAGAVSWIDAVHCAAHEPIDVQTLGCDVLLCSPYKFCGPHLGIAYIRRELAETWRPYKARAVGVVAHREAVRDGRIRMGCSWVLATVEYPLIGGMDAIRAYERSLGERFLANLPKSIELYGPATMDGRVPTFLFNVDGVGAGEAARRLGERGLGVWSAGNWYCVGLDELLPEESLRVGFIHYNGVEEVDRLVAELDRLFRTTSVAARA